MKKYLIVYIYYAILLVFYAMGQTAMSEPPLVRRLLFMVAVLLPAACIKEVSYPAIITLFLTITASGMGYSYMPYTLPLYILITVFFVPFEKRKNNKEKIPKFIIIITIYIILIDLLTGSLAGLPGTHVFENNHLCLLLLCFFLLIAANNRQLHIQQLSICFAASTIVLSILFLTIGRQMFTESYYGTSEERIQWTDPNYLGMSIGMGTVFGVIKIFSLGWKDVNLIEKLLYLSTIVISLPVLVLNASRGALLAVGLAFVATVLMSKTKTYYKALLVVLVIGALGYLYTNEYFDLLAKRVESDDGTGSSRTVIWSRKLNAFLDGGLLNVFLGVGLIGGAMAGYTDHLGHGFHNDFLAHLVDYGLIGFFALLFMLYYPIKIVPRKSEERTSVIVMILYLAICFLTLEPLSLGVLSHYVFYMCALLIALNEKRKSDIKR